jgi:hypothetical protein
MRAIVVPFGKRTSMGELIEGTWHRSGVEAVLWEGTLKPNFNAAAFSVRSLSMA